MKKKVGQGRKTGLNFKEKAASFTNFKSFVMYRINLEIGSIMRLTHIYLTAPRVHIKCGLYAVSCRKGSTL